MINARFIVLFRTERDETASATPALLIELRSPLRSRDAVLVHQLAIEPVPPNVGIVLAILLSAGVVA
jgi:hypothetical protein